MKKCNILTKISRYTINSLCEYCLRKMKKYSISINLSQIADKIETPQ